MEMNKETSDWRLQAERYIKGECSPEAAASWEALMLSEDAALDMYIQAMSEMESELPDMADPDDFTDRVLADEGMIPYRARVIPLSSDRPRKWYEKPLFHYTVAASITLVFMFSGTFDRLFPEDTKHRLPQSESPSYSEQLMEKTTNWLDMILPR